MHFGHALPLLLTLAVLGCDSSRPPDSTRPQPSAKPTKKRVSLPAHLAGICDGEELQEAAAPYEKKLGKVSPAVYFYKDLTFPADSKRFKLLQPSQLKPWTARKVEEIELVACLTVTKAKKERDCKFNTGNVMEMYSTTSTLAIHEAKTGKKLEENTVEDDAQKGGCPSSALMRAKKQRNYGGLVTTVTLAIGRYQPADAPPPNLAAWTFEAACTGKPALGAGKLSRDPGAFNPFAVFLREGEGAFYYGDVVTYQFDKEWFQPNLDARSGTKEPRTSLAICMTSTRGKKALDCPFSGGKKLLVYRGQWKVDVVEAATGETIQSKDFPSANQCPTIWKFDRGTEWTSEPGKAMTEWLRKVVAPK